MPQEVTNDVTAPVNLCGSSAGRAHSSGDWTGLRQGVTAAARHGYYRSMACPYRKTQSLGGDAAARIVRLSRTMMLVIDSISMDLVSIPLSTTTAILACRPNVPNSIRSKTLAVHARQLFLQSRLQVLRQHHRPLPRSSEYANRADLAHHDYRTTQMGPWVTINARRYYDRSDKGENGPCSAETSGPGDVCPFWLDPNLHRFFRV